ncbi:hypothetical protein PRZ48_009421 [Zasmidium cellare]|uniref:Uncharacterized protein n=1 Tax=Zasmidium cellare TaxID=395010 RepID=A0ABR0ECC3_ZASCE|nr:hypothetical protein PRZ48_009421 [Zasmidium cellare]
MVLNALLSEAFLAVLRKWDEYVGDFNTVEKQDAFLRDVLATHDLRYKPTNSKELVQHNADSLYKAISGSVCRNLKAPKDSKYRSYLDCFLQQGSDCIKPDYLRAIGYEAATTASSAQASSSRPDAVPPLQDDSDDDDRPLGRKRKFPAHSDFQEARKRAKIVNLTESENGDSVGHNEISTTSSPVQTGRNKGGKKRGVEAIFDDDEDFAGPPQKQQKLGEETEADRSRGFPSGHSIHEASSGGSQDKSSVDSGRIHGAHDGVQGARQEAAARHHQDPGAKVSSSDDPRNHFQQDASTAQSSSGKGKARGNEADDRFRDEIYQASGDLQTPFAISSGLPFALLAEDFEQQVNRLESLVDNVVIFFLRDLEMGTMGTNNAANIVARPCPALEELYKKVFGPRWEEYTSKLLSSYDLHKFNLLKGLVSAFLVNKVFIASKLPWRSPLEIFDDPAMSSVKKYLGDLVNERNADFARIIREASMRQVRDQEFQDTTIAGEASILAFELLHALHEQMVYLGSKRCTTEGWYDRLKENLTKVCKQALKLHAMTTASSDEYSIIWPIGKAPFDGKTMQTTVGTMPEDGVRNYFPVFPGWNCDPALEMYGRLALAKATVTTDVSKPRGIYNNIM